MNTTSAAHAVSRWVILMLALGAGFSVASIYYAQPLLPLMGADLHLSIEGMGMVPTLTRGICSGDPVPAAARRPTRPQNTDPDKSAARRYFCLAVA